MAQLAVDSPIGALVLTTRDDHLVAIEWTERAEQEGRSDAVLTATRDQLAAYFDGRLAHFDLPIAPAGTPFQQRVWQAMCVIPAGHTATYGELAATLGSSARAVGNACGTNPIPIVVPCHRVVGRDGRLDGYSGGAGPMTKRFLLGLEGACLPL